MVNVARTRLESAIAGKEKTWFVRIYHRGAWLNLTSGTGGPFTVTGAAYADATAEAGVTVTVSVPTQTDDDAGLVKATIASTALTAARVGEWYMDLYIAESGGNAQPLTRRFVFTLEPDGVSA